MKFDPTNQTPQWSAWTPGHMEMLFNKTESDQPDIREKTTDHGLLERCASVPFHWYRLKVAERYPFVVSGTVLVSTLGSDD